MSGRAAQYRDWLAGFGFSGEDWRRIKAMAAEMDGLNRPAALDDLSVPYRVGVTDLDIGGGTTGRVLGRLGDRLLLYWPMDERRYSEWARRRRGAKAG